MGYQSTVLLVWGFISLNKANSITKSAISHATGATVQTTYTYQINSTSGSKDVTSWSTTPMLTSTVNQPADEDYWKETESAKERNVFTPHPLLLDAVISSAIIFGVLLLMVIVFCIMRECPPRCRLISKIVDNMMKRNTSGGLGERQVSQSTICTTL